ncbi:MAG: tetratricopeptide repeat protein [Calditrichaeota bacterium]|nr:tetratricopeptide repeat protein [Calditrichota bacterium]MCB0313814.1 tetratricopeptide repeat protein [Calditrichota bacterium]MCB9089998.1 tetratricopeptide repeat protein [Calditrichia bacterium]
MSTQCKSCGGDLPADAKFCLHCGAPAAPKESACPDCSAVNPADAKFCKNCGVALSTASAKQAKAKTKPARTPATSAAASLSPHHRLILSSVAAAALIVTSVYYYIVFVQAESGKNTWQSPHNTQQAQAAADDHDHDHDHDHDADHTGNTNFQPPSEADFEAAKNQLSQSPDDPALNTHLGNLYFDSGKYAEAIPYYQKALSQNPDDPDVIVDLGVCYFNLDDYQTAKTQFQQALTIAPKHVNALYNLGVVAVQMGNVDELIQHWTLLREVAPNSQQAQRAMQILDQIHKNVSQPQGDG